MNSVVFPSKDEQCKCVVISREHIVCCCYTKTASCVVLHPRKNFVFSPFTFAQNAGDVSELHEGGGDGVRPGRRRAPAHPDAAAAPADARRGRVLRSVPTSNQQRSCEFVEKIKRQFYLECFIRIDICNQSRLEQ